MKGLKRPLGKAELVWGRSSGIDKNVVSGDKAKKKGKVLLTDLI